MAAGYSEETSTVSTTEDLVSCRDAHTLARSSDTVFDSSHRSPLATLTGVQVLGTGAYVPETVVRNEDLTLLGCDADWISSAPGFVSGGGWPPTKRRVTWRMRRRYVVWTMRGSADGTST